MHSAFGLECVFRDEGFFDEGAVKFEDLKPIVGPVGNIDELVVGYQYRMNGIVETGGGGSRGDVGAGWELETVVWLFPVCAPMALIGAGIRVENNNAAVEVSIRHKQFIGFRIYEKAGGTSDIIRVVAAPIFAGMPDLQQEFAFVGELQYLVILFGVAAEPH